MKAILVFALLATCLVSQPCLDPNGNAVSWWVMLLYPGSVPGGFSYIDSSKTDPSFTIFEQAPDSTNSPLTRTLTQINTMSLQSIAWND